MDSFQPFSGIWSQCIRLSRNFPLWCLWLPFFLCSSLLCSFLNFFLSETCLNNILCGWVTGLPCKWPFPQLQLLLCTGDSWGPLDLSRELHPSCQLSLDIPTGASHGHGHLSLNILQPQLIIPPVQNALLMFSVWAMSASPLWTAHPKPGRRPQCLPSLFSWDRSVWFFLCSASHIRLLHVWLLSLFLTFIISILDYSFIDSNDCSGT